MESNLQIWRRNLYICCVASFVVAVGMSQMAPILPLYIEELGVTGAGEVARWSGIVYGCNFFSLAIFSPIWGRLADRYGRKPMILRASCWLGLIMIGMSFAQAVWQLVALRLLQGCLSGFQAAVVPLLAQETPKEHSGWAMGACSSRHRSQAPCWGLCSVVSSRSARASARVSSASARCACSASSP